MLHLNRHVADVWPHRRAVLAGDRAELFVHAAEGRGLDAGNTEDFTDVYRLYIESL